MLQQTCRNEWCNKSFEVPDDDLQFYQKVSPTFSGRKEEIPAPALCPDCRSARRMLWRNERILSVRPCGLCKKQKVSMFFPADPFHAYCHDCFYGDGWNPLTYGREYDFSKSFEANMDDMLHDVPLVMLYQSGINENCEFTNYFGPDSRNCYLIYNSGRDEDCSYSRGLIESKQCLDMLIGSGNQFCYECVNASENYRVFYSQNVAQCSDSAFLFNCRRCRNCFGCTNLVQKEYYLFNEPCTPEQYKQHMENLSSAKFVDAMKAKMEQMRRTCIHRENNNINAEGCTGDYLTSSKNCQDSYESKGSEDCKRLLCSRLCKDSQDIFGYGYDSQLLYDNCGVGLCTCVAFSWICSTSSDSYYCFLCDSIQNCFGCVSLRHKKYCIFNKQYSQEEYEALVPKIIAAMRKEGVWGEFLPKELAPFAYNDTVAQEFLPLTREEAIARAYKWNDILPVSPQATRTVPSAEVPDSIDAVSDDILQTAILCEYSLKPFRLTKPELEFLRTMRLPVPLVHPDERHRLRMELRNPCSLNNRICDYCSKPIRTTYAPDRPEKVYCEDCYLKEVY